MAASLAYLLKVLRVRLSSSTDDPPVHDLAAFRTPWDGLAPEHQRRISPLIERLRALGFEPYRKVRGPAKLALFVELFSSFAAMKGFGYRNVRMFFIPFLGAAVTGVPRKDSVEQFRALAVKMGTLPTAEGKPSARINETARFGFVQRNERSLDFMQFHFIDLAVGPALFTRWLESRGCSDFRHAFDAATTMGQGDDDEDDEDGAVGMLDEPRVDAGP